MCVPEYVYGMILVESQETRMSRQQGHHESQCWRLASVLVKLLEMITDTIACSWMVQRECKRELHLQRWTLNSEVT